MIIKNFKIFEKAYVTHGNGGKPYAIEFDDKHNHVDILKNKYKRYSNVKKVWTGDKEDDNSSVLIEFPHKKYIFVGTEVYEFETDEFITDYYSIIGNNDVPYPVALSDNYVYLMLEKIYIDKKVFPDKTDWKVCYGFYYDHERSLPIKKFKNLQIIEEVNEKLNEGFSEDILKGDKTFIVKDVLKYCKKYGLG